MVEGEALHALYGACNADDARTLYDGVAATYDADNLAMGFRLPLLGAAFVARHVPAGGEPVLDAGCGTGLLGEALAPLGYGNVHGVDLSPGMLREAQARGVYTSLAACDLGKPLPFEDRAFSAVACFGSFGPGHAPPEALLELSRVLWYFCPLIFNVREDTYEAQGFAALMAQMEASGAWQLLERSPPFRPYLLTEPDLYARIFVYRVRGG